MAVEISYKSRIKKIVESLRPLAQEKGFNIIYSDQKISSIRNSSKPLMYIGINSHQKMSFQSYTGDYNPEKGYFENYGVYVSLNKIFIDFYTFDYDFIDISQEVCLLLNYTDFSLYNMTASFFEVISNSIDPSMIQSQLKQSSKVITSWMMTDKIALPPVYKADRITVNGSISGLDFKVEVDLDGQN